MKKDFSRRDFNRLTAAALGGVVAGAVVGCDNGTEGASGEGEGNEGEGGEGDTTEVSYDPSKHACRGLNECKNLGASGENECAGQGTCATVEHSCGPFNDCRYQGGCGDIPGANECAGKGGCHVPVTMEGKWDQARELFEARMAEAGKEVGPAPAPAEED